MFDRLATEHGTVGALPSALRSQIIAMSHERATMVAQLRFTELRRRMCTPSFRLAFET